MEFAVIHKEAFDLDYANLNRDLQKRIARHVYPVLRTQPHMKHGDTIQPLRGFEKIWRYRIGDYRLIYAVYPDKKLVQLLAVGPRSQVYRRFALNPEDEKFPSYASALEDALNPDTPAPDKLIPYLQRKKSKDLPVLLTRSKLQEWNIPENLWPLFEKCRTEEELLSCRAPEEYILYIVEKIWPTPMEQLAQQPNMVLHSFEDLIRFAEGDIVHFLLYLDEEQKRFVNWAFQGPTLIKGGPGSGKSTVALYRVQQVVEHGLSENGKGLFVTYTNALINASRDLLKKLLKDKANRVDVSTLDKIARTIVYDEIGYYQDIATGKEEREIIEEIKIEFPLLEDLTSYYIQEEIRWVIEGQGLDTKKKYLNAQRPGRRIRFSLQKRESIWQLYEALKTRLHDSGRITWGELRLQALEIIQKAGDNFSKWDFVVIDEAQDLPPVALSLAVDLCKQPAGVFLTADATQSIYNKGFAWKNVHSALNLRGRTRIMRRNYRTTQQIAEAAHSLVRGTGVADEDALKQKYVRIGPKPTLFVSRDESESFRWLAQALKVALKELRLPSNSAVVLTRTNDLAKQAAVQLIAHGLLAKYVSGKSLNLQEPGTKVMTIHSAKGLEFPIVALPYFDEGVFPLPREEATSAEMQEAEDQDLRLLYVAWTRAMYRLFVTCQKGKGTPFLALLDMSLWEVIA